MSRAPRARLSDGKKVSVTLPENRQPGLANGGPAINTEPDRGEALPVRAGRSILSLVLIIGLMLAMIYVALAATVMVALRADGHTVLVLRGAFAEGKAPVGEYVYASSSPTNYSLIGKVNAAVFGVDAGSVVQIVSGPNATVSTDKNGFIVVDGKTTQFRGVVDSQTLARRHVAICITGACVPGQPVLVGQNAILGKAKGYIGISGIKPIAPDASPQGK